jgi:hypothetical protein
MAPRGDIPEQPEKRAEAEAAIKAFYQKNKADMERRGVTEAIVK